MMEKAALQEANDALAKTNRMNLLFDFYEHLLTKKQQKYLKLYYHDNYSLSEIAQAFSISRQAVNEHIKRAEHMLEEYESKLHLWSHYEQRQQYYKQLQALLRDSQELQDEHSKPLTAIIEKLIRLE